MYYKLLSAVIIESNPGNPLSGFCCCSQLRLSNHLGKNNTHLPKALRKIIKRNCVSMISLDSLT